LPLLRRSSLPYSDISHPTHPRHTPSTLFSYVISPPPRSPLFPYTTLFRSDNPRLGAISYSSRGSIWPNHLEAATLWIVRPIRVSDRKSTRLNSSHSQISYAGFCLKKKKKICVR